MADTSDILQHLNILGRADNFDTKFNEAGATLTRHGLRDPYKSRFNTARYGLDTHIASLAGLDAHPNANEAAEHVNSIINALRGIVRVGIVRPDPASFEEAINYLNESVAELISALPVPRHVEDEQTQHQYNNDFGDQPEPQFDDSGQFPWIPSLNRAETINTDRERGFVDQAEDVRADSSPANLPRQQPAQTRGQQPAHMQGQQPVYTTHTTSAGHTVKRFRSMGNSGFVMGDHITDSFLREHGTTSALPQGPSHTYEIVELDGNSRGVIGNQYGGDSILAMPRSETASAPPAPNTVSRSSPGLIRSILTGARRTPPR